MHFSCILNLGNHQFNIKGWGGILISEWFSLGTQSADSIYCINEKKIEYKVLFWGQTNVLIMFFFFLLTHALPSFQSILDVFFISWEATSRGKINSLLYNGFFPRKMEKVEYYPTGGINK